MRNVMMILLVLVMLLVSVTGIGSMNQFVMDGVLTEITPQAVMVPDSVESFEIKSVFNLSEQATIYNYDNPAAEQFDMLMNVNCDVANEHPIIPEEIMYPLRL